MGKILMSLSVLLEKFLSGASQLLSILFIFQIRIFCYPVLLREGKLHQDRLDWHWLIIICNSFAFLELIFLPSQTTLSFLALQHTDEHVLVCIYKIVSLCLLSLCMDLIVLVT